MRPCFAIAAECKFRRTEHVVTAAEYSDRNSSNGDRLGREIQQRDHREEFLVAAETARVDSDRVIDDRDPDGDRHVQPLRR